MEKAMQRWKFFCGVNVTLHDVIEEREVKFGKNFYFTLPFLGLSGIIIEIKGKQYYATMPIAYTSEALSHYHVRLTEGGYRLQGTREAFELHEITEATFDNELNPIPADRRKERDAVMAKYKGKEPFKLNLQF